MADMNDERCETCRFWKRSTNEDAPVGECRRFPPFVNIERTSVGAALWCGEWRAKAVEKENPLATELALFEKNREEWLENREGKFVLIRGPFSHYGFYDTDEDAYRTGIGAWGNVPMFIKQVLVEDRVDYILLAAEGRAAIMTDDNQARSDTGRSGAPHSDADAIGTVGSSATGPAKPADV